MDQAPVSQRSNIARPLSRLPLARASALPTPIHQDEPSKASQLPRAATSNSGKPAARVKPLGESKNIPAKKTFGWSARFNGIISPTSATLPASNNTTLDTTPPSKKSEFAIVESDGNENSTIDEVAKDIDNVQSQKRAPRLSLSERTIETLSQISPAPSPTRRRSSTVKSNGSMGPPPRPASSMRNSRPSTPSTPASDRPLSPTKRPFRPPGKPTTPAKERSMPPLDSIYTPPKAFVRDHSSRIGRPARDNRRSISTAVTLNPTDKPALKPTRSAAKVKSMYDLRAANTRGATSRPALPSSTNGPATPGTLERRSSYKEVSPQTGLMKARGPGENVLATGLKSSTTTKPSISKKLVKRQPASKQPDQPDQPETTVSDSIKSSTALRETIAKAKAAKREQLRKSSAIGDSGETQPWAANDAPSSDPIISLGPQSLKKKIWNAVTSGSLNLSAMSLKSMPDEVLAMYDYKEDAGIAWSEAIDLKKLLMADNEIEELSDTAFPDWSSEDLFNDPEKSNQFGGLEVLDLHGNNLQSVPIGIRRLHNLRVLNLSNNALNITIFSILSELRELKELRLAKNGLNGDLPSQCFSNMSKLQVLDLSDNQLDSLPASITELQSLQKLFLGGNRFSSLTLSSILESSLIELDLSKNMLGSSFDAEELRRFQKLQSLDLSFNNLESLSTNSFDLPSLQTLAVHNNRIDTLPNISRCQQLTTLTAAANGLTSIPEGFYSLASLRNVDFSGNSIRNIGQELVSMVNLSAFNITGNPLREKKYLTMNANEIKEDIEKKLGPIEAHVPTASMAEQAGAANGESSTSEDTNQLLKPKSGVLDVSSRNLSSLQPDQVDLSGPVHTIRLGNNDFSVFPVELLMHPSVKWSLRALDISHNPALHPTDYLTSEVHLPVLQSLYIVSTGLTTLDSLTTHLKAPELKELNISCHRLTGHVPWIRAWYPAVTTLLASDNWFESIDVEGVRGLEVLDIRNNEVEVLPPRIGLLGNHVNKNEAGRLRIFECGGNKFRVPRLIVVERGTEAVLKDLRRMIPTQDVPEEWQNEI